MTASHAEQVVRANQQEANRQRVLDNLPKTTCNNCKDTSKAEEGVCCVCYAGTRTIVGEMTDA